MPVKDYATLRLEAPQTSPIGNPAVAVHEVRKLAAGPHPASQQYQQQQLYQQQQQQQQYQLQQQQQQQHPQYLGLGRPVPQSPCESPPGGSQCSPQLTQLQSCARQVRQAGQVCTPRRLGKVAQRAAQLRSPVVKRPVGAPVAQQGWLHKQGSDGLMLWKKRWFVLCDYCLFYYKGPEEEKLLGSILLPSYTISPCSPQVDKVYRKFSFKAEHVNMRTYYFASDTHEGMLQWMHCMSLASVLQDRPSYEEPRVINQQPTNSQHSPGDESDAGFGTYRPRLAVSSGSMNGWQSPLLQQPQQQPQQQQQQQQQQNAFDDRNYHHHLYANAPPKPRRLANEDMGSSSEQSPEHHQSLSQSMSQSISQSMNAQPQQPPRLMQTNYQYNPGAVPQVQSRLVMSPNNAERRTPDTYSRPAGTVQPNVAGKIKLGDYEDVYNSERNQLWTNKFGQAAYLQTSGSSATIITKGYEATYNNHVEAAKQQPQQPQQLQQPQQQQLQQQQLSSLLGQTPRAKQPPRPHSADFLEYDARRHEEVIDMAKNQEPQVRGSRSQFNLQPPRPKSSLDIMRDPDNLYWSEEGYAQKMRQSAYVLQQTPGGALPNPQVPTRNNFPSFSNMLQSQSSSRVSELAANRVLSPSAELMRESEQQHILNMQRRQQQLLEEQKILQQELEYQKQQSHQEQLQRQQIEEEEERQLLSYYSEMQAPMSQQPFMRSASARLPRHRYDPERDDDDEAYKPRRNSGSGAGLYAHRRPGSEYGSQKFQQYTAVSTTPDMSTSSSLEATAPREESMKRLLEWKQRMLQSPLARKPSGSATRGVNSAQNQLSNYYKQQALRELADQERRAQGLEISRHLSQDALVDVPYLNNSKLMEMQDLVDDQAGSVPWSTEMLDSQETADFLALKSQEDAGKMSRSRSQDGRRSSASNRYTSYSSDEDIGDTREPRKRSRRPSQSSRSRRSSTEEKTTRKAVSFETQTVLEDAKNNLLRGNSQQNEAEFLRDNVPRGYQEWANTERQTTSELFSKTYEDRYFSGKCSDSGYDTLQNGAAVNAAGDTISRNSLKLKSHSMDQQSASISLRELNSSLVETKLDEAAIIREYSYQYVKSQGFSNSNLLEGTKSLSRNLVSNRKKLFEDQTGNSTGSQGSSEYLNEIEIPEHQIRSRSILKSFVFGDGSTNEPAIEETKYPKSVKDLLADFEKKSKLAKERAAELERRSEEDGRRHVFSDTETLMYDTSSDPEILTEPVVNKSRRGAWQTGKQSQDEDEDGEVAAALACRDLVKKKVGDLIETKTSCVQAASDGRTPPMHQLQDEEDLRDLKTPDMSAMQDSTEEHYLPMTPSKKTLSDTLFNTPTMYQVEESSYVEMTTGGLSRSLLAPNSSMLFGSGMASAATRPISGSILDGGNSSGQSHYELMYRVGTAHEPLYMEVSSTSEATANPAEAQDKPGLPGLPPVQHARQYSNCSAHRATSSGTPDQHFDDNLSDHIPPTPPRLSLPDILNSSNPKSSLKSESSDADDEASKDLDSLDTPRHPRFSLSDTFRPASYYLGASGASLGLGLGGAVSDRETSGNEHHDSSDSELVSPPPIPTSPPPLDDLDTSLDINDSSLDVSKARLSPIQSISSQKDFASPSPSWLHGRGGSFSGSMTDNATLQRSPSQSSRTAVDEALQEALDSVSNPGTVRKRRPASDIIDRFDDPAYISRTSLDSIGRRSGVALDFNGADGMDIDRYLGNLHVTTPSPSPSPSASRDYNHRRSNSYREDDEILYENLQAFPPPPPPEMLQVQALQTEPASPQVPPGPTRGAMADQSGPPPATPLPPQQQQTRVVQDGVPGGDQSQAGAPYYYSDLLRGSTEDAEAMAGAAGAAAAAAAERERSLAAARTQNSGRSRLQPLNNQRSNNHARPSRPESRTQHLDVKRNDVGRKVNPINATATSPSSAASAASASQGMAAADRLAEDVRNTSESFLGAEKCGRVDQRNLYESDTLQRSSRQSRPVRSHTPDFLEHNLYPNGLRDKRRRSRSVEGLLDEPGLSPTTSLLHQQQHHQLQHARQQAQQRLQPQQQYPAGSSGMAQSGADMWEEDSLWRESLRRVSLRHTRSLDNLDDGPVPTTPTSRNAPSPAHGAHATVTMRTTRAASYSSSARSARRRSEPPRQGPANATARDYEDYRESQLAVDDRDDGVHYERLSRFRNHDDYAWDEDQETFRKQRPSNNINTNIHKPFLEQGPPPTTPQVGGGAGSGSGRQTSGTMGRRGQGGKGELERGRPRQRQQQQQQHHQQQTSAASTVSLSLSGAGSSRDFALAQSQVQVQVQGPQAPRDSTATRALSSLSARINSLDREITALSRSQTMELSTPESLASPDSSTSPPSPGDFLELIRPRTWESLEVQEARAKEALEFREAYQAHKVSAGELLGRTHEELVLLLIQLRRSSAAVCKAMESCHMEIETQARLAELDTPKQMEHLQRLDDLKKQLVELEKQHEKGKPLVNLVDNMVKLGSLYQSGSPTSGLLGSSSMQSLGGIPVRERLEFNYKVQEQRLLAEERRDWDRLSPDYGQLQAKVQQLYRLDQEMQEESHTLQTLQVDKELVERALTGVRLKLATAQIPPNLRDTYRKQQRLLERELSRIRLLLAHNSKKLEETVAENARLEQELVILRQKLQTSRQESFSSPPLGMVDADYPLTPDENPNSTAHLEAELKRVQLIMGDLHRQRQEISVAVKQLTEKADPVRPGPTGVAGAGPIPGKKKQQSSWVETDLDSLVSRETGNNSQPTSPVSISVSVSSNGSTPLSSSTVPLYVNTGLEKPQADTGGETQTLLASNDSSTTSLSQIELSEADDRMKRFYGIIPKEKQQEFKTVRIVKRESERRQRDRDRSGNIGIPLFTSTGKRVALLEDQSDNTEQRTQQSILGQLLESEEACAPLPSHMDIFPSSISNPTTSASLLNNEPTLLSVSNAMTTSLTNTSSMSIATTSSSSSNYMSSSWAQEGANDSSQALDEAMAQLDDELEMSAEAVFQRSHSLPRGFGKTNAQGMEVEAAPSMDNKYNFRMKKPLVASAPGSESNLSMAGMRRQRVRFDTHSGSGSESNTSSPSGSRPLSAREQLFGSAADDHLMTGYSMLGLASRETSPQLSPVFSNHAAYQSEAARQIVMEMNACSPSVLPPQRVAQQKVLKQRQAQPQQQPQDSQQSQSTQRRLVPREKRRHHTVSGRPLSEISSSPLPVLGTRSRDDLDMERALRTRHNVAPDVVRSTLSRRAPKFDADTIDSILGTPGKIHIPERYVPENEPALSQEERLQRLRKADAIRKMLSETRSGTSLPSASGEEEPPTSTLKKKAEEEKKQHEHLLQLNQLLAKQVMEKSKIVAEKALSQCPPEDEDKSTSDDESPEHPLPLYQQRENFYS